MPYKLVLKIALLFCGLLSLPSYAIDILHNHPSCAPEILEVFKVKAAMQSKNGLLSHEVKKETSKSLIILIEEKAREIGAEAIILKKKTLIKPESKKTGKAAVDRFTMTWEAELIKFCENDKSLSKRATKYDSLGEVQFSLGGIGIAEKQFKIHLPGTQRTELPALDTTAITFKKGLYGVTLGVSTQQVKEHFGFPTAEFTLNNTNVVYLYGRNHWLFFETDKLVKATTVNKYFERNLENALPFDDRFDGITWKIFGALEKGMTKSQYQQWYEKESPKETLSQLQNVKLGQKVVLEPIWNSGKQRVLGFNYGKSNYNVPSMEINNVEHEYLWLSSLLDGEIQNPELLNHIKTQSQGKIYQDRVTVQYIYDTFLNVELLNNKLKKISISDAQFRTNTVSTPETWTFGKVSYNQPLDEVVKLLPESALQIGDKITVNFQNRSESYYFYETENQQRLYQVEVLVF